MVGVEENGPGRRGYGAKGGRIRFRGRRGPRAGAQDLKQAMQARDSEGACENDDMLFWGCVR